MNLDLIKVTPNIDFADFNHYLNYVLENISFANFNDFNKNKSNIKATLGLSDPKADMLLKFICSFSSISGLTTLRLFDYIQPTTLRDVDSCKKLLTAALNPESHLAKDYSEAIQQLKNVYVNEYKLYTGDYSSQILQSLKSEIRSCIAMSAVLQASLDNSENLEIPVLNHKDMNIFFNDDVFDITNESWAIVITFCLTCIISYFLFIKSKTDQHVSLNEIKILSKLLEEQRITFLYVNPGVNKARSALISKRKRLNSLNPSNDSLARQYTIDRLREIYVCEYSKNEYPTFKKFVTHAAKKLKVYCEEHDFAIWSDSTVRARINEIKRELAQESE